MGVAPSEVGRTTAPGTHTTEHDMSKKITTADLTKALAQARALNVRSGVRAGGGNEKYRY